MHDAYERKVTGSSPWEWRQAQDDASGLPDLSSGEVVDVVRGPDGATYVTVRLVERASLRQIGPRGRLPISDLLERMHSVSERHQLAHSVAEQVFYLRGHPLDLAIQEYRLLRYLAERPRRLLTTTQILQHAWPAGFEGNLNALRATLCRLRKKLGAAEALIQNRHGRGYQFDGDAALPSTLYDAR